MIEINNLICLHKNSILPPKIQGFETLTFTLKSPGGQNYHKLKDFV